MKGIKAVGLVGDGLLVASRCCDLSVCAVWSSGDSSVGVVVSLMTHVVGSEILQDWFLCTGACNR